MSTFTAMYAIRQSRILLKLYMFEAITQNLISLSSILLYGIHIQLHIHVIARSLIDDGNFHLYYTEQTKTTKGKMSTEDCISVSMVSAVICHHNRRFACQ
jgi:hypothetical protein